MLYVFFFFFFSFLFFSNIDIIFKIIIRFVINHFCKGLVKKCLLKRKEKKRKNALFVA
jgi:hypothetical protein